jgi:hypothetical protein
LQHLILNIRDVSLPYQNESLKEREKLRKEEEEGKRMNSEETVTR